MPCKDFSAQLAGADRVFCGNYATYDHEAQTLRPVRNLRVSSPVQDGFRVKYADIRVESDFYVAFFFQSVDLGR